MRLKVANYFCLYSEAPLRKHTATWFLQVKLFTVSNSLRLHYLVQFGMKCKLVTYC